MLGRWFSKIAAAARKPFTVTAAQRRRAFAAPETDSSLLILFCGYVWGRGENAFRRTKVTTIHTTGRSHRRIMVAGCPRSRGVRDPGGPSSITRPAKPRTHPGLEKQGWLFGRRPGAPARVNEWSAQRLKLRKPTTFPQPCIAPTQVSKSARPGAPTVT